ncbi:ArsA family ATPase [Streptomyces sp. NBC_00513]|uniref:ArsA family ATPase n=1 Tax=unclassified Streptomyces TaxID=2593676 RepID=UPI00225BC63F|nr:ArsA family ATPase [Streptomyces sp. NBC_00424]MCX5074704.1 ArsA family ATPase [Streptomyces sp. NBC_00424]WUD42126.1 ArsA family ATPase [Streptomyces sp. NBC_00513]
MGASTGMNTPPPLAVDALLDDPKTRIIVCCGAGGVGKTTTAAALGVRAAERGRKVVVLTIDPARRLAQSMGIDSLDNTPRRVKGVGTGDDGGDGDGGDGGELHAMMLDMKRTFDEIVEAHADGERAQAILANPFYQSLSAGFAGTQEYMAMEKLGQLRAKDDWDLIVVDTPPSRSALDFLDAPKRLGSFLDGRFIRVLMAPAKVGGRAGMKFLNVGMSMMTGTLSKLMGASLLKDVQTFVAAMDTMFGGFRTRADATFRLLQAPGTAFLVVAAPEPDALREAAYFVERLAADRMPLAGLVLNRVHVSGADRLSAERALAAAENLEDGGIVDQESGKAGLRDAAAEAAAPAPGALETGSPSAGTTEHGTDRPTTHQDGTDRHDPNRHGIDRDAAVTPDADGEGEGNADDDADVDAITAGLLRLHAERMQVIARERRTHDRFTSLHPEVAVAEVAALPGDVHDLAGLRAIGERLAAGVPAGA